MPRPAIDADDLPGKQNATSRSPSKDSTHKDAAEIARQFDRHLKGLAAMFNKLQNQHQHELLQAVLPPVEPPRISTFSRPSHGVEMEKHHAIRRASECSASSNQHKAVEDLLAILDCKQGCASQDRSPQKADDMVHRQYKAQFNRLDKAANGHLEEEDLMAVMHEFNRGWELQDIHDLLREINRFVAAHKSQMSPHSPHGLSHSSSARNIGRGASHESIDLDGFIALISSEELVEGGGMKTAVRRDCKILREALKAENNYNLYKDDGHFTQGEKIRGPSGKMALMADVLPGIVIVINALVLGISSDVEPSHVVWIVFNYFFSGLLLCRIFDQNRLVWMALVLLWQRVGLEWI